MVCQRVLIINEGSIVAEDTPDHLTSSLQAADRIHIQVRRPAADLPMRLQNVPGVQAIEESDPGVYEVECAPGSDHREDLAAAVIQGGWGLLELRQVSMSLEEVFLKLTTSDEEEGEEEGDEESEEAEGDEAQEEETKQR